MVQMRGVHCWSTFRRQKTTLWNQLAAFVYHTLFGLAAQLPIRISYLPIFILLIISHPNLGTDFFELVISALDPRANYSSISHRPFCPSPKNLSVSTKLGKVLHDHEGLALLNSIQPCTTPVNSHHGYNTRAEPHVGMIERGTMRHCS